MPLSAFLLELFKSDLTANESLTLQYYFKTYLRKTVSNLQFFRPLKLCWSFQNRLRNYFSPK